MEQHRTDKTSRVIPFDQNGEAFRLKAQKRMDESDLWGALSYLRRAREKDPCDGEVMLDTAELLAQMGLYEQSCEQLFEVVLTGTPKHISESYYALGCNFLAVGEARLAEDCLSTYLLMEPDGDFLEDCRDMLAQIGDMLKDRGLADAARLDAQRGKRDLDDGFYEEAAQKLERAVRADGSMLDARNNLALSYYCLHEDDKAREQCTLVLAQDAKDIHALCNLALVENTQGRTAQAETLAGKAAAQIDQADDDEQFKICVTLAELGMDAQALEAAEKILAWSPYEPQALTVRAVALYNLNQPQKALRGFNRLLLLEPGNFISRSLQTRAARDAVADRSVGRMDYVPILPLEQVVERIALLQGWVTAPKERRQERWDAETALREAARWGFTLGDGKLKRKVCQTLAELERPEATLLLKRQLVSLTQVDEFKKELVLLLATNGEHGPYPAILGEHLAQIKVRGALPGDRKLPVAYERALKRALSWLAQTQDEEIMRAAVRVWTRYMMTLPDVLPPLRAEGAWAAAICRCASLVNGQTVDLDQLSHSFHTRRASLLDRADLLMTAYEQIREVPTDEMP